MGPPNLLAPSRDSLRWRTVSTRDALRYPHLLYGLRPSRGGVFEAVKHLPSGALIVSNSPEELWIASQRAAVLTPVRVRITTARRNPHLGRDIQQVGTLTRERCTYLVVLPDTYLGGRRVLNVDELRTRFDLREQAAFANGSISTLADGKPCTRAPEPSRRASVSRARARRAGMRRGAPRTIRQDWWSRRTLVRG